MKLPKGLLLIGRLLAFVALLGAFYVFGSGKDFTQKPSKPKTSQEATPSSSAAPTEAETADSQAKADGLPDVQSGDWELVLVNREHPIGEVQPELGFVGEIPVDSRIVAATTSFLEAVHAIDANPEQGLYSGYRSVAEQEELFQQRVAEAMETGLTAEEAESTVAETVMPAGFSEHHTGLAIDLMPGSALSAEIAALAPEHGFVLRFPADKTAITGISYEDWHFRYVGVASAKYMTEHNLTLEEYLQELQAAGR